MAISNKRCLTGVSFLSPQNGDTYAHSRSWMICVHMSKMFALRADDILYWNRPYCLETIEKDGISQPHWTLLTNAWTHTSHESKFNAHWECSHGRREKRIEARLVTWSSSKQSQTHAMHVTRSLLFQGAYNFEPRSGNSTKYIRRSARSKNFPIRKFLYEPYVHACTWAY